MILDFHTHRYADEVARDPEAFARAQREPHWAKLHAGPQSLQDWPSRDQILRDMDAAGIEKAVLLGWYWENARTCALQNRWHLRWVEEDPDRFLAFAAFHPGREGEGLACTLGALEAGLCGVGELLPRAQGYTRDDPVYQELLGWCQDHGIPVLHHATETVGRAHAGRIETPLEDFLTLAREYPKVPLVLAHWGGGLPFFHLGRGDLRKINTLFYDSSASPLLYEDAVYESVRQLAGADRILFGSDYPLRIYPKLTAGEGRCRMIAGARRNLNEKHQAAFFCDNARAMLRMLPQA